MSKRAAVFGIVACVLIASLSAPASALIFFNTGDPNNYDTNYNTTAPTGAYANSGWNYEGAWGIGGGTVIGPQEFLTAQHFSVSPQTFYYNGQSYNVTAVYNDPNSDLRICKIDGTFSTWAPIYSGSSEVGQTAVIFGRGDTRGDPVTDQAPGYGLQRGWTWSTTGQGTLRWGTNAIEGTSPLGPSGSTLLYANFDANSGYPDECTLAAGDSGGGVFIQDNGVWKLAGVNYGVQPLSYKLPATVLQAAVYDARGMYSGNTQTGYWQYNNPHGAVAPASMFFTRTSPEYNWILQQLPLPGDANMDGKVDVTDLQAWLAGSVDPTATGWANGDFNGDGKVDIKDLQIWLSGSTDTAGIQPSGVTATPEPVTLTLLTAGAGCMLRRRHS